MSSLTKKVALLLRAERLLLRLRVRELFIVFLCLCSALCFLLIGLIIGHVASFMALKDKLGSLWAGGVLASFDLVLATALIVYALKEKTGSTEKQLALEAKELTLASLGDEFAELRAELSFWGAESKRWRSVISSLFGGVSVGWGWLQFITDLLKSESKAKESPQRGTKDDEQTGSASTSTPHSDSVDS